MYQILFSALTEFMRYIHRTILWKSYHISLHLYSWEIQHLNLRNQARSCGSVVFHLNWYFPSVLATGNWFYLLHFHHSIETPFWTNEVVTLSTVCGYENMIRGYMWQQMSSALWWHSSILESGIERERSSASSHFFSFAFVPLTFSITPVSEIYVKFSFLILIFKNKFYHEVYKSRNLSK